MHPTLFFAACKLGFVLILLLPAPDTLGAVVAQRPWEQVLVVLDDRLELLTAELERIQKSLAIRAAEEDPTLLERLEPPKRRPWGYGIIPEITLSPEHKKAALKRQVYSLEGLEKWLERTATRVEGLGTQGSRESDHALKPLVVEFEALRRTRRNQEKNLAYHRFWQKSVVDHSAFFAERNRLLDRVREWRSFAAAEGDCERCPALHHEIVQSVARFRPTRSLTVKVDADGTRVLPVEISTDINDDDFLEGFIAAVAEAFEHSEAALNNQFRVELEITRIPSEQLYPDKRPETGEHLNTTDHLGRFPKGALVLTTGAKSTHARTGRYVQLGPHPSSRRTLAHEFGHLLGFEDGYLRACDGSPDDPYGMVLIEWRGLLDNLMGSPGHGRVTEDMIDQLIAVYGD